MAKIIAEQSNALSIFWLKKKQAFISKQLDGGVRTGWSKWTWGSSESSIGFTINIADENSYIRLQYTYTDRFTGEKENMDYRVRLTTTPCNYGGKRYWFICPLSKNGKYCGRRIGILYLIGKYFGCRHCGEITYNSQMQSERYKGFVSIPDIEKAEKEVKRYYYNGKPTRKYRKLIRLNEKFRWGLFKMAAKFDKKFGRLVDLHK